MNKKIIFILSFILMVSFCSGIFIQFLTTDQVTLSAENVTFWQGLWSGFRIDILITACALVLSLIVYSVPFVMLIIMGQVFSLGFTAAWLLSAHPQGLPIICAVLLPRCLIKLPAYVALTFLSFETAASRHKQKRQRLFWQPYMICLTFLMFSSLLEAVLHLLTVLP